MLSVTPVRAIVTEVIMSDGFTMYAVVFADVCAAVAPVLCPAPVIPIFVIRMNALVDALGAT